MKGLSKDNTLIKIAIYILPLCYLFYSTFKGIFTTNSTTTNGRATLLIVWLTAGYVISSKAKPVQPIISAIVFCLYTLLIYLLSCSIAGGISISILSCICVWPFAFYNATNINFSKSAIQIVAILVGITCNVMAFYWSFGKNTEFLLNPVAAQNSIYYVLIAFLYIFLIDNTLIMTLLMAYPLTTLISSGKTTCVILSVLIVLYFAFRRFKIASRGQKFGILAILLVAIWWGLGNFALDDIFDSASADFGNGGSGRLDIWDRAFTIIGNLSIESIIGHGYGATVEFLGIGAHNDFLEVFIDFGAIGLSLYLVFIYNLIKSIRRFKYCPNYKITYTLSIIIYLALSCVSKLVGTQVQFLLFTTLWGLLLANTKQHRINETY